MVPTAVTPSSILQKAASALKERRNQRQQPQALYWRRDVVSVLRNGSSWRSEQQPRVLVSIAHDVLATKAKTLARSKPATALSVLPLYCQRSACRALAKSLAGNLTRHEAPVRTHITEPAIRGVANAATKHVRTLSGAAYCCCCELEPTRLILYADTALQLCGNASKSLKACKLRGN